MNRPLVLLGSLILVSAPLLLCGDNSVVRAQQLSRTIRRPASHHSPSSQTRRKNQTTNGSSTDTKSETIRATAGDTLASIAARLGIPAEELGRLNGRDVNSKLKRGQRVSLPPRGPSTTAAAGAESERKIIGRRILLADGTTLAVDDVWKQGDDFWYRAGGTSNQLTRPVRTIEPIFASPPQTEATPLVVATNTSAIKGGASGFLIYMVGGARVRADEVNQTETGAWYRRGNLTNFLDKERIARIEKDEPESKPAGWKQRGWTSGNEKLDELIKTNGARFSVDPYLIFCVIEQESQFHVRALSPKGARGLMQLMPGTMARYGVRNGFDPAANVFGGTQYLKQLLDMFSGRLDLTLASYNAGEGAVIKHGRQVPPYKETREYVRRISKRYGVAEKGNEQRQSTTASRNE